MDFISTGHFHITSLLIASVVHHVCPFRKCHVPSHTLNTHAVLIFG